MFNSGSCFSLSLSLSLSPKTSFNTLGVLLPQLRDFVQVFEQKQGRTLPTIRYVFCPDLSRYLSPFAFFLEERGKEN